MDSRQIKTTLKGDLLAEFEELRERFGLNCSSTMKLAVRRLARIELQNQAAPPTNARGAA